MQSTRSNEFHQKMDDFLQKKEDKLKHMRDEKAKKEVEGCIFAPKIYTRKAGDSLEPRKFD